MECDLASVPSVSSAIERIVHKGLAFDILVNCGGITQRGAPEDFPDELWNEVRTDSNRSRLIEGSASESQCAVSAIEILCQIPPVSEETREDNQHCVFDVISRYKRNVGAYLY